MAQMFGRNFNTSSGIIYIESQLLNFDGRIETIHYSSGHRWYDQAAQRGMGSLQTAKSLTALGLRM
jgi:hypothetical protein